MTRCIEVARATSCHLNEPGAVLEVAAVTVLCHRRPRRETVQMAVAFAFAASESSSLSNILLLQLLLASGNLHPVVHSHPITRGPALARSLA